ncbi:MAG: alpha-glucosidase [Ardenticatenaceae bacterium]|nr:alpha-glucosidase [Ardenticatenaceae bacterium]
MNKAWWKESVVYQIYPRSFKDSNGDGIGDLRGIIEKLDYLQELGIDVVWLSPVYKSPNDDNGYDISNYQDIMDEFGTLADWEALVAGMHKRGLKLVMDLVVNHTSDEHSWFQQSRQAKDNPYRDFYIWRPGKDGQEPNNWVSFFSGSAWQYDETTDEYFLHVFTKRQPDLNWENPKVRQAVYDMMHWWLQKGVDGFRMDVINLISKVPGLPDAPITGEGKYQFGGQFFANGPRLMEFLREMKDEVLSHYDIITVGETPLVTTQHGLEMTHEETGALNMVFQFEHMDLDRERDSVTNLLVAKPWHLTALKEIMGRWQKDLETGGWNSLYLDNHDQPRGLSRFGDDGRYRVESAKMLATFVHMQQGTPYIYQGDEIGMTNVAFPSIEDYRDVWLLNGYQQAVEQGVDPEKVLAMIQPTSRDNARTPMQWDATAHAGFTSGEPWIKVNPNYVHINTQQALADPDSIFYYYQKLIRLRKQHSVIVYGTYDLILPDDEQIYAFTRTLGNEQLVVILNFKAETAVFRLPDHITYTTQPELLISNYEVDPAQSIEQFDLRPFEARVYHLTN